MEDLVNVTEFARIWGERTEKGEFSRQAVYWQLNNNPDWFPKPAKKAARKGQWFKRRDAEALRDGSWNGGK